MKPAAEMSRDELLEEVAYLRGVMYGDPRDEDVRKLCDKLTLHPAEGRILSLLDRARGRTVLKWRLLEEMRPERTAERVCDHNALRVRITHIRARIGRESIGTVLGATAMTVGYRLTESGREVVARALG